jgi:hypothetical protein
MWRVECAFPFALSTISRPSSSCSSWSRSSEADDDHFQIRLVFSQAITLCLCSMMMLSKYQHSSQTHRICTIGTGDVLYVLYYACQNFALMIFQLWNAQIVIKHGWIDIKLISNFANSCAINYRAEIDQPNWKWTEKKTEREKYLIKQAITMELIDWWLLKERTQTQRAVSSASSWLLITFWKPAYYSSQNQHLKIT